MSPVLMSAREGEIGKKEEEEKKRDEGSKQRVYV
jgi:hypothetical protein